MRPGPNAFGNALGNSIAGHIQYKREHAVQVPEHVGSLGPEADGAYRRAVAQGKSEVQAFDAATRAAGEASSIQTHAIGDPNAPRAEPLHVETMYADGGEGYHHPAPSNEVAFAYDHHALDRQVFGPPIQGLIWLNDQTRIPGVGEIKQGAQGILDDFADYTIGGSWPRPIAGSAYALGAATLGLLPETALEFVPEFGALGKAGKAARTIDDLPSARGLGRIGPTADDLTARFEPLGLTENPLDSADGRRLVLDLQSTGLSPDQALTRARNLYESGTTVPVATPIDQTDRLIKLVPQGNAAPNGSAFWMTEAEYRFLQTNPTNAPGRLGLPAQQYTDTYDVYVMRPADSGAVVYESRIAPTRQGGYLQPGGLRQTLVTNPSQFTPPAVIGTFRW